MEKERGHPISCRLPSDAQVENSQKFIPVGSTLESQPEPARDVSLMAGEFQMEPTAIATNPME